ncbi:MAG: hypothetical protein Nk1A_6630 [Endomicrobiia bacterium]|nr:MAG: hypothetical protein Nk1A_6630 [Endomicrobiia bacterium]
MTANENNRNAYAGRDAEFLIKNSVLARPSTIEKIKSRFNIRGDLNNAESVGVYGGKADVRINFACGRYIDVSVKSFKTAAGFNQLARTSVSKFCKDFGLNAYDARALENIVATKSKNPKNPLFPPLHRQKWGEFFQNNAKRLLEWGFSKNADREILVLYNRETSIVKIYPMKEVLNCLPTNINFTKGGFNIGDVVSFQRKGGNGALSKHIPKTAIEHPGNNVQLKVKIIKLMPVLESVKLDEYEL